MAEEKPVEPAVEYVEIAGLQWAKYNLGATPGDTITSWFGNYYAWGETTEIIVDFTNNTCSPSCDWNYYEYANGAYNKLTKYCPTNKTDYWDGIGSPDGLSTLESTDDAVAANLSGWRMPTKVEFQALLNATNQEWRDSYNGISGLMGALLTDKTDNTKTLFFPITGRCGGSNYAHSWHGNYWTSDLYDDYPYFGYEFNFFFDTGETEFSTSMSPDYRYYGSSVRPVRSAN